MRRYPCTEELPKPTRRLDMKNANQFLREMFLDYFNNYLTVALFAEHNELSVTEATSLIEMGRNLHEEYVELMKK